MLYKKIHLLLFIFVTAFGCFFFLRPQPRHAWITKSMFEFAVADPKSASKVREARLKKIRVVWIKYY